MTDIYKWLYGSRGRAAVRNPLPPLPEVLEPYASAIGATVLPVVGAAVIDGPPSGPSSCQLGGRPWWPRGLAFPCGKSGVPLYLLAQINFAELPSLSPFPTSGLLQVFIGAGDLYGANLDDLTAPADFACVYHEDLAAAVDTRIAPKALAAGVHSPLEAPFEPRALSFQIDQMVVDVSDYRFERLLPDIAADETLTEAYAEWTTGEASVSAIRLGGYPTFTQDDPRRWRDHPNYRHYKKIGDFGLMTVDTTAGVMWGDAGAAQFLMHEQDLLKRDFSRVIYNWDCC